MPIGTSDGNYYENDFEHATAQHDPALDVNLQQPRIDVYKGKAPEVKDPGDRGMVMDPEINDLNTKDENILPPSSLPTMPPQAPREPAGALESTGSTNTPEKVVFRTSSPLVNITDADIDTAINIGMGAGPGTMKGVKALTFDKAALAKAQELEANATHPDDIHAATGTFRGADTKWRQEIDDSKAALNPKAFDSLITPATSGSDGMGKATMGWGDVGGHEAVHTMSLKTQVPDFFGNTKPVFLKDVLDHPELYKAYPDVANVKIAQLPAYLKEIAHGSMDSNTNTLHIGENLHPEYIKSIILHEVQHKIQDIEGFAKGGNPMQFKSEALRVEEKKFIDAASKTQRQLKQDYALSDAQFSSLKNAIRNPTSGSEGMLSREDPKLIQRLKDVVDGEEILKQESRKQSEQYSRLMGEVEARNVQKRMAMDKFERAYKPPRSTEDRPRFIQINTDEAGKPLAEKPTEFRRAANENFPEGHPDRPYNIREPGMIGSKANDDAIDAAWKRMGERQDKLAPIHKQIDELMGKYPHTEFDKARLKKLRQQRTDIEEGL